MIKLIAGIVSSYRYYHHRQDCRTRWQWPVSSVSQPHHGEFDIAVQKLLKNTSRASQHVTPRAALWAKRFSLRNTRHHQSPPTATPPPPLLDNVTFTAQNARKIVKEQSSYNLWRQFSGNKNTKLAYDVVKCCCSMEFSVSGSYIEQIWGFLYFFLITFLWQCGLLVLVLFTGLPLGFWVPSAVKALNSDFSLTECVGWREIEKFDRGVL